MDVCSKLKIDDMGIKTLIILHKPLRMPSVKHLSPNTFPVAIRACKYIPIADSYLLIGFLSL